MTMLRAMSTSFLGVELLSGEDADDSTVNVGRAGSSIQPEMTANAEAKPRAMAPVRGIGIDVMFQEIMCRWSGASAVLVAGARSAR